MFGMRTPVAKKLKARVERSESGSSIVAEAGPSVCHSPEEREAEIVSEARPQKTPSPQPKSPKRSPPKLRPKTILPQESRLEQTIILSSPPSQTTQPTRYMNRMTEAKACLSKVKMQVVSSRNLKKEIAYEITKAAERLYHLVKEAGADKETSAELENATESIPPQQTPRQEFPTELVNQLMDSLQSHNRALEDCKQHTQALSEQLKEAPRYVAGQGPTFAEIAATSKIQFREPLHSVIVSSTSDQDTGEVVIEKLRTAVDAKNEGTRVERLRKARDRKVVVGFGSREEMTRATERIKRAGNLMVEEVKNKDPLIIIKDVLSCHSDEEVIQAIKCQNHHLIGDVPAEDARMGIKYRRRTRNPHTCHIILQVSPALWQRLTSAGRLHIDLQRVRVLDQSPLVQCTRCLRYGHTRKMCTETADVCIHCGDLHLRADCPLRQAAEPPKCRNCLLAKMPKIDHNAFDSECPVRRKNLATQELLIEAGDRKVALALLQEPYVGGIRKMRDYHGVRIFQSADQGEGTVKSAIAVFNHDLDVLQCPELTTNNITVVRIRTRAWEIAVVSFYFEPDQPIEPYLEQLRRIREEMGHLDIIVGGDANAKSTWWGSSIIDSRGEEVAGSFEDMGLQVLNTGNTPTFDTFRGGKQFTSFVDLTACSEGLLGLIEDWRVESGITSSDHNGIVFKIKLQKSKGININRQTRIYNTKKANWSQFREKLAQLEEEYQINSIEINKINNTQSLDQSIQNYINIIIKTSQETIPKIKNNSLVNIPWWSTELVEMKNEVNTRRRRIRCAAKIRRQKGVEEYLQAKEKYEHEAMKAQVQSWKGFCEKQDREGCEDVPLVKDGLPLSPENSARLLAETFYPVDSEEGETEDHRRTREDADRSNVWSHDEHHDPPFTLLELKTAVDSFNPKKAPGADGLTADICAQAIFRDPGIFLALANKCLEQGHFPGAWKEATVVILRKPGKDTYTAPKSYRPIGLLPVLGKILEKLMVARLKWHLVPRLSTRQFGFMPQKSTEDSLYTMIQHIKEKLNDKKLITVVSLDIEGAFDSAWWPAIRTRLAEEKCPVNIRRMIDSYLNDRCVRVRYAGAECRRDTNKGCVQGSIGGPILWNLVLDPLLKGLEQRGDYCQAFADDVVLIFSGDTALEIQRRANAALEYVRGWGIRNKLKFAPHKTCAMVVTRKLKYDVPLLSMGGVAIGMSEEIKILGLTVDHKLTFNTHVANVCKKAINIYKQLARAAKVSWGLHPEVIRSIYTAAVEPVILYAASAWAPAAKKVGVQKLLNSVQRGFAQKLCGAYRTVSLHSALVLAGLLPLDLRIQEAAALYEKKKGVTSLAGREVERVVAFADTPHPAKHTAMGFVSLVDQSHVESHNSQDIRFFTDGSKIEGKVGAALSLWDREAEIKSSKLSLPSCCTVYQAELLAICVATRQILRRREGTFGIYSDSKAALQTVTNQSALHALAVEARANLSVALSQGKVTSLFWIKAHAGLEGNERADHLAKEAALKNKTRPDYDLCPVSFVKRQIRLESLGEWNRRYGNGATAGVTKIFLPDAADAYRIVRKILPRGVITQVLTGHGGFSEYLHRFKCKENPSCICDPSAIESVPHIILECPIFARERWTLEQELDTELSLQNISHIMHKRKAREKFLEYAETVANKIIRRNKEA
ncbi:uncharacterized protein LOC124636164 [Helicoverpa zea]|uniref:uncharacterized protein LOC124636164 n=1 Tax=Helicoverpa zea TaxID=7113 RepID=UPI001F596046|nr:uncharacterized protein LOC124636164 [Helicoverpa zea]